MVKASRFRNRKINFKSRLAIRTGSLDVPIDDVPDLSGLDGDLVSVDLAGSGHDRLHVETGVDKEEEGEIHLQNAISASAATILGRAIAGPSTAGRGNTSPTQFKAAAIHIPTPDATGIVAEYESLYATHVFREPVTMVRFSDTVEDTSGITYTLDEDDEDWLISYNSQFADGHSDRLHTANGLNGVHRDIDGNRLSKSPRRDKGKEVALQPGPLGEDDFELLMDHFEKTTEDQVPLLHLDLSRLPTMTELEESLSASHAYPHLASLKIFARMVYAHWKERRLKRDGRPIIPLLDYDETREDNPYVCFRRREPKNVRKTRRTDAQNLERLIRLRGDLTSARDLLQTVLERERCKRDAADTDMIVFEGRTRLRDLKRQLGENDGDEDLLVGRKERKRRRTEDGLSGPPSGSFKVPLRIARPELGNLAAPVSLLTEPITPYKDRTAVVSSRIEREMTRKRDLDRDWEDWTDGAYLPTPLPTPAKYWRAPDPIAVLSPDGNAKEYVCTFNQPYPHAIGGVRPSYRKRVGRGGRIFLDRTTVHSRLRELSADLDDNDAGMRLLSQWRFDSDAVADLPLGDDMAVIDDYHLTYVCNRLDLLRPGDLESLQAPLSFLDEARAWLAREPERPPPNQIVGKLPSRPPPPSAPTISMQPSGIGMGSGQPIATPAQPAGQIAMAANHAHQVAQSQVRVRAGSKGPVGPGGVNGAPPSVLPQQAVGQPPPLRRAGSGSAPQVGVNGLSLPANMQAPTQWNGYQKMDGSASFQGLQIPQFQTAAMPPNGLHRTAAGMALPGSPALPHGANGLPATSRLSAPPYPTPAQPSQLSPVPNGGPIANGVAATVALQRRPASQASSHGSPALTSQMLPHSPRPGSGSSTTGSPALQLQSLPAVPTPPTLRQKRPSPSLSLQGAMPPKANLAASFANYSAHPALPNAS